MTLVFIFVIYTIFLTGLIQYEFAKIADQIDLIDFDIQILLRDTYTIKNGKIFNFDENKYACGFKPQHRMFRFSHNKKSNIRRFNRPRTKRLK